MTPAAAALATMTPAMTIPAAPALATMTLAMTTPAAAATLAAGTPDTGGMTRAVTAAAMAAAVPLAAMVDPLEAVAEEAVTAN
jgi:hypothetical protein